MSKLISLGAGIACGAAVAVSLALPLPVKELSTWGKYGGLAVGLWVWSELWFWCWMKRVVVPSMQAITKPPKMDRAERQRLWKRCLAWPGVSAEDFIRGWFFDADFDSISVVDCEAWLSWGLWGVTQDDLAIEEKEELREMRDMLEGKIGRPFPPHKEGAAPLPCATFTFDPVPHTHYLFAGYFLTMVVFDLATKYCLRQRGFKRVPHHPGRRDGDLKFWYRHVPESDAAPIVFAHGVGVGLGPYMQVVDGLLSTGSSILLVEVPFVSVRILEYVPSIEECVAQIGAAMTTCGIEMGMLCGHSFGNNLVSWMVKLKPERVSSVVLLDPCVLMLHLSTSLRGFIYESTRGWSVGSVLRTEPFISYTVRRHVWWFKNILFAEDVHVPSLTVLSEGDLLVPAAEVWDYYSRCVHVTSSGHHVTMMLHGHSHGSFLTEPEGRTIIFDKMRELCSLTKVYCPISNPLPKLGRGLSRGSLSDGESPKAKFMGSHQDLEALTRLWGDGVPAKNSTSSSSGSRAGNSAGESGSSSEEDKCGETRSGKHSPDMN